MPRSRNAPPSQPQDGTNARPAPDAALGFLPIDREHIDNLAAPNQHVQPPEQPQAPPQGPQAEFRYGMPGAGQGNYNDIKVTLSGLKNGPPQRREAEVLTSSQWRATLRSTGAQFGNMYAAQAQPQGPNPVPPPEPYGPPPPPPEQYGPPPPPPEPYGPPAPPPGFNPNPGPSPLDVPHAFIAATAEEDVRQFGAKPTRSARDRWFGSKKQYDSTNATPEGRERNAAVLADAAGVSEQRAEMLAAEEELHGVDREHYQRGLLGRAWDNVRRGNHGERRAYEKRVDEKALLYRQALSNSIQERVNAKNAYQHTPEYAAWLDQQYDKVKNERAAVFARTGDAKFAPGSAESRKALAHLEPGNPKRTQYINRFAPGSRDRAVLEARYMRSVASRDMFTRSERVRKQKQNQELAKHSLAKVERAVTKTFRWIGERNKALEQKGPAGKIAARLIRVGVSAGVGTAAAVAVGALGAGVLGIGSAGAALGGSALLWRVGRSAIMSTGVGAAVGAYGGKLQGVLVGRGAERARRSSHGGNAATAADIAEMRRVERTSGAEAIAASRRKWERRSSMIAGGLLFGGIEHAMANPDISHFVHGTIDKIEGDLGAMKGELLRAANEASLIPSAWGAEHVAAPWTGHFGGIPEPGNPNPDVHYANPLHTPHSPGETGVSHTTPPGAPSAHPMGPDAHGHAEGVKGNIAPAESPMRSNIDVGAEKGLGYEAMLHHVQEAAINQGLHASDFPDGTDMHTLLAAAGTKDNFGVLHTLAEHKGFFNTATDHSSIVDRTAHMSFIVQGPGKGTIEFSQHDFIPEPPPVPPPVPAMGTHSAPLPDPNAGPDYPNPPGPNVLHSAPLPDNGAPLNASHPLERYSNPLPDPNAGPDYPNPPGPINNPPAQNFNLGTTPNFAADQPPIQPFTIPHGGGELPQMNHGAIDEAVRNAGQHDVNAAPHVAAGEHAPVGPIDTAHAKVPEYSTISVEVPPGGGANAGALALLDHLKGTNIPAAFPAGSDIARLAAEQAQGHNLGRLLEQIAISHHWVQPDGTGSIHIPEGARFGLDGHGNITWEPPTGAGGGHEIPLPPPPPPPMPAETAGAHHEVGGVHQEVGREINHDPTGISGSAEADKLMDWYAQHPDYRGGVRIDPVTGDVLGPIAAEHAVQPHAEAMHGLTATHPEATPHSFTASAQELRSVHVYNSEYGPVAYGGSTADQLKAAYEQLMKHPLNPDGTRSYVMMQGPARAGQPPFIMEVTTNPGGELYIVDPIPTSPDELGTISPTDFTGIIE